MEKYLHMLGKPARKSLIEYALSKYSAAELAGILGLSKAAISKYVSGETHPSDRVLEKLIQTADEELRAKLLERIAGELVDALIELMREYREAAGPVKSETLLRDVCDVLCSLSWEGSNPGTG